MDDRFPCDAASGSPLFTKPNDDEMWVMIMEKAFAKVWGGSSSGTTAKSQEGTSR